MFWKGLTEERARRGPSGPSDGGGHGKKTRKRQQTQGKQQSGKRRRIQKPEPIEDAADDFGLAASALDVGAADANLLESHSNPYDNASGSDSSSSSADSDSDFAGSDQTAVSEPEMELQGAPAQDEHADADANENSADEFLDELFEEDVRLGPIAEDDNPLAEAADEENLQQPQPPLPPPAEPPPADPAREPRQRELVQRGGLESRDVFTLPNGLGTLRYYRASSSMQAFCPWGRDVHETDCRKSAGCNPAKRGSGRPIGLLVAWLRAHSDFATKHEHVHTCKPSLQQRRDARAWFMQLRGASDFAEFEKPKADPNDDDEPAKV